MRLPPSSAPSSAGQRALAKIHKATRFTRGIKNAIPSPCNLPSRKLDITNITGAVHLSMTPALCNLLTQIRPPNIGTIPQAGFSGSE